ncbi:MAG: zinc finger domain-containing protein [Candidatus Altiarchaeota archaeon]
MINCSTCGKGIVKNYVEFKCPNCGKTNFIRCNSCRILGVKYKCNECGFIGP